MQLLIIAKHVREGFNLRLIEWCFAMIMFTWGYRVLVYDDALSGQTFAGFLMVAPAWKWGSAAMIAGAIRMLALAVNGAWKPNYLVRAVMDCVGLVLWLMITFGLLWGGAVGTGLAIYPWFAVFELFILFRCAKEAAAALDIRKATT